MSSYFVVISGKVTGPKSEGEVRDLLLSGTIKNSDPIFLEGSEKWRPAAEFECFAQVEIEKKPEPSISDSIAWEIPTDELNPQWIVLARKKTAEVSKFLPPVGPYNPRQVIERLKSGAISYDDYAWRPGFTEWHRLGTVHEFTDRDRANKPTESLDAVVTMEPQPAPTPIIESPMDFDFEPRPLSQPEAVLNEELPAFPESPLKISEEVQEKSRSPSVKPGPWKKIRKSRASATLARAVAVLGSLAFIALGFHLLLAGMGFVDGVGEKLPQATPKSTAPPAPATPTQVHIEVRPLKTTLEEVMLGIETNAPVERPIELVIRGESGQIVRDVSYFRRAEMRRHPGEATTLDMSSWNLAEGSYRVEARVGSEQNSVKFFVGDGGESFQEALRRHRKRIAHRQQTEKFTLLSIANRLTSNDSESSRSDAVNEAIVNIQALQETASDDGMAYPELIEQTLADLESIRASMSDRLPANALNSFEALRLRAGALSSMGPIPTR